MATLVLTTVGTLVGGPIGGAIGAIIGQQADQRLFAPKGRQGPRLGELSVQVSRYGQPIPRLFGRMRVAGTVIWATDLRETRHRSGGGKGKPKVTTYSYSASFAVALSARPIRAVHRIWADGKLLRGAAGDWKSETGFRLHLGGEGQAADPLIAAAEGIGRTPANRGIAYAVFQDMQLADYGNRIPSLTFEVEADSGPISLATIAADLSDGATGGGTAPAIHGFAASGDSVRGAIEALAGAMPLTIRDDGERLLLSDGDTAPVAIDPQETGATAGDGRADRISIERRAAGLLPDAVSIAYHDPARDYQSGLQRARRGGPGRRAEAIELPAALSAGSAKAMAERQLAERWAARTQAKLRLPWRRAGLRPGEMVRIGADPAMRIAGWTLDGMTIDLTLRGTTHAAAGAIASAGEGVREADAPHGPTTLALIDLPPLDETAQTAPHIWIAAAGAERGWRRAAISISSDGGGSWQDIGATAAPAIMGVAETALQAAGSTLIDRRNSVDIALLHDGMALFGRDDAALIQGANLAMLGDELIQFGDAQPIGPARWRLSRLLRGRRGTEDRAFAHGPGERFVLIEAASLLAIEQPAATIGATIEVMASGVGDAAPVTASRALTARALRPPSPVALRATRHDTGDIAIGWTRRSRTGWQWIDGRDAPLGEEDERYTLTLTPSVGRARTLSPTGPSALYSAAERAADGASAAGSIHISVTQIGLGGASAPATMTLPL